MGESTVAHVCREIPIPGLVSHRYEVGTKSNLKNINKKTRIRVGRTFIF
jgi:hypothetical protein